MIAQYNNRDLSNIVSATDEKNFLRENLHQDEMDSEERLSARLKTTEKFYLNQNQNTLILAGDLENLAKKKESTDKSPLL